MSEWIISSSAVITAVLLIRFCFKERIGAKLRYALWLIVLVRLLLPVQIGESAISAAQLDHLLPKWSAQTEERILALTEQQKTEDIADADSAGTLPSEPVNIINHRERMTSHQAADIRRAWRTVWCIGAILVGAVLLWGNLRFWFRLKRSRAAMDIEPISGNIRVWRAAWLSSPCLFGFPIPSIYLRDADLADAETERYILAHETAHLRQGDAVWNFLRCVCLVLHWYNPLVWAAAILSKQDSELACDAEVIRMLGDGERIAYGKALLSLHTSQASAAASGIKTVLSSAADAVPANQEQIGVRIRALMKCAKTRQAALIAVVLCSAAVLCIGFTAVSSGKLEAGIHAPASVREAALAWAEEIIAAEERGRAQNEQRLREMLEDYPSDPLAESLTAVSDWKITALEPVMAYAPLCGRNIMLYRMELRTYSEYYKGHIWNLSDVQYDGSGWGIRSNTFFLAVDTDTNEIVFRYENIDETQLPGEQDFDFDLRFRVRYYAFYDSWNGLVPEHRAMRNIGGMSLYAVAEIAAGRAPDPYHYVDDVCYKVERVSSSAHPRWGEEQIYRVIVNETGEEVGRALFYPEHNDIAIWEG